MKRLIASAAIFSLSLIQTSLAGDTDMTKEQTDVRAVVETMTKDFQNADINAVMSAYEPGAVVLFEPGQPLSGDASLRAAFAEMASLNPVFEYSGHEVVVTGDIAVHFAPWHMTGKTPDGEAIEQSGLSVAILRKQADGSWKMVIDNPNGAHLMAAAQ